jgi:hypothetical protein
VSRNLGKGNTNVPVLSYDFRTDYAYYYPWYHTGVCGYFKINTMGNYAGNYRRNCGARHTLHEKEVIVVQTDNCTISLNTASFISGWLIVPRLKSAIIPVIEIAL